VTESIITDISSEGASSDGASGTGRPRQRGEIRTRIADGLVALFKEYYGRGPDQARAYYVDDIAVCVLRGGFTRVEETLLDAGKREVVVEQRKLFQEVMAHRFRTLIEEITGRTVIGFISGNQPDPEMTCEVFVLGPETGDSSS
jgi:uncharacterized protein YbcI